MATENEIEEEYQDMLNKADISYNIGFLNKHQYEFLIEEINEWYNNIKKKEMYGSDT